MGDDPAGKSSAVPGFVAVGTILVGIGSTAVAIEAIDKQQFTGAGICCVAAAVTFGLLSNAVFRD